jgi:hypothetical protein
MVTEVSRKCASSSSTGGERLLQSLMMAIRPDISVTVAQRRIWGLHGGPTRVPVYTPTELRLFRDRKMKTVAALESCAGGDGSTKAVTVQSGPRINLRPGRGLL